MIDVPAPDAVDRILLREAAAFLAGRAPGGRGR